jgi:central kinetochore subunit Mis15/CHL4
MSGYSIPIKSRLSPSLRIDPANATVQKILNRLSRQSLLALALDWLEDAQGLSTPFLRRRHSDQDEDEGEDEDAFYPLARSRSELRTRYSDMQTEKGSRRDVIDRVIEADWKHGLTLYQLAMADFRYLCDHPAAQKWTAYRILPLMSTTTEDGEGQSLKVDKESLTIPRFHPGTFVKNLQDQILPDVKAHYYFGRVKDLAMEILRIFILDSPYNTDLALDAGGSDRSAVSFDSSRTIFIAFPDASPFIYISKSQTIGPPEQGESRSLRSLVVEGIPKALSRPRHRYTIKVTNLTTRNLSALLQSRGGGRTNSAGGGWSIFADETKANSPLDTLLPTPPLSDASSDDGAQPEVNSAGNRKRLASVLPHEQGHAKRAKMAAQARFGGSAKVGDGKGIERVDVMIEDPFPDAEQTEDVEEKGNEIADAQKARRRSRHSNIDLAFQREADSRATDEPENGASGLPTWTPAVRLTFHGRHVFAGIRQLVEAGIIDGQRMPGWLTGEEGVNLGAVKHGRVRGHKGSGL